jgi:hypothetical protein
VGEGAGALGHLGTLAGRGRLLLGDISAHFNPAATLGFALRRDMEWGMVIACWVVQFAAAACGSLLARAFFGPEGKLAATVPQPGQDWQAVGFETVITFGLILMILNLADGPKLNGPFVPLAVGAYVIAWAAGAGEATAAEGTPLHRDTVGRETEVPAARTPQRRAPCLSNKLTSCVKIAHLCGSKPHRRVTDGGLAVTSGCPDSVREPFPRARDRRSSRRSMTAGGPESG